MKTIAEFVMELARNEELRALYHSDPRRAAEDFGLEGEKLELILAGNLRNVRIKIEGELEVDGETISFFTIWWFKQAD